MGGKGAGDSEGELASLDLLAEPVQFGAFADIILRDHRMECDAPLRFAGPSARCTPSPPSTSMPAATSATKARSAGSARRAPNTSTAAPWCSRRGGGPV